MKSLVLVTALLLPSIALAQAPAEPAPQAATQAPAARAAKPAPRPAAPRVEKKPAQTTPDVLDIAQILGVRQVDPATYEIDARLQNGSEIHLRANAFVMQSLGAQLGTFGR